MQDMQTCKKSMGKWPIHVHLCLLCVGAAGARCVAMGGLAVPHFTNPPTALNNVCVCYWPVSLCGAAWLWGNSCSHVGAACLPACLREARSLTQACTTTTPGRWMASKSGFANCFLLLRTYLGARLGACACQSLSILGGLGGTAPCKQVQAARRAEE